MLCEMGEKSVCVGVCVNGVKLSKEEIKKKVKRMNEEEITKCMLYVLYKRIIGVGSNVGKEVCKEEVVCKVGESKEEVLQKIHSKTPGSALKL